MVFCIARFGSDTSQGKPTEVSLFEGVAQPIRQYPAAILGS